MGKCSVREERALKRFIYGSFASSECLYTDFKYGRRDTNAAERS